MSDSYWYCFSDVYEGTRLARKTDLPGIREVIQPLEETGALVRRTNEQVSLSLFLSLSLPYYLLIYQQPSLDLYLSISICQFLSTCCTPFVVFSLSRVFSLSISPFAFSLSSYSSSYPSTTIHRSLSAICLYPSINCYQCIVYPLLYHRAGGFLSDFCCLIYIYIFSLFHALFIFLCFSHLPCYISYMLICFTC